MFHFGVDYYPEHWPEERWLEDARLMAEASINVVRLAEFAWSYLEPRPDHFCFDWLDRALDILQAHSIQAVLGTPTASPPPWVMALYPNAYRVPESGQRQTYGNRREYCPTHPGYRERGRIITRAMAEHYVDHPAVIGWQIDNEFGRRCYCFICQAHFQAWLQEKYGSLDRLNDAWGTIFWSHVYTDWSQIPVPVATGGVPNPGLDLDYRRFMSDTYVRFQQEQVDILRRICPNHFVTHNFMSFGYDGINYFDLAQALDFVAWDNYPRNAWHLSKDVDAAPIALGHDTMRGLKGQNFWVMEEESGSGGWQTVGMTPRPGEMRLWTYQAIAHGANAIVYFRWRTARFGTEQYWHGILDHHGQPRRRYREIQTIGAELKQVGEQVLEAESRPQVAMLLSYDARFAFQTQPNHPDFSYPALFSSYYAALHHRNVGVDIVSPTADLSRYRLVLAPALHVLSQDAADNLRRYVESGGTLLTTARSGVKDEVNAVVNAPLPGLLAEICGVEVDEYDALPPDVRNELEFTLAELASNAPRVDPSGFGKPEGSSRSSSAFASVWCDVLKPNGATVVARYTQQYYAGQPAITLNRFGQGQAVYVGTIGDEALHDTIVGWLVDTASVSPVMPTPDGVEAVERWRDNRASEECVRLLFLLNHTDQDRDVVLPQPLTDLLTGQVVERQVTLAPKAVMMLHET